VVDAAQPPEDAAVGRRHDAIVNGWNAHGDDRSPAHDHRLRHEVDLCLVRDEPDPVERGLIERAADEPPVIGHADDDGAPGGHRHRHDGLLQSARRLLELELLVLEAAEATPEGPCADSDRTTRVGAGRAVHRMLSNLAP
jgi:hypothetical protein